MNKKISLGAAIAFMVVVAGITFCITMMVSLNHFNTMVLNVKNREEMYKKIADVDREVRQNFNGTIDEETLMDAISSGYIKGLGDKYSSYLTKDQYEQALKDASGKEVGIGITFVKEESGYLRVRKVLGGSPAEDAGIQKGDYIISIADTDLKLVSSDNAERLMKGEVGTKLKLVYRRDGVDTPKDDIVRTDIRMPTVEWRMVGENAVIQISKFDKITHVEFQEALDGAVRENATGLIFDLRNCTGDNLDAAKSMLNTLLPAGKIGTLIDKSGNKSVLGTSDKYEVELPMTTIINGKTTGVAELFVAVLRDFGKANSVGITSYGKALLQTTIPLTDGSAINLTTAHYYPPSGEEINGVGIKPDYEVKLSSEQEAGFDNLTDETDPQIQKALEVINSKKTK